MWKPHENYFKRVSASQLKNVSRLSNTLLQIAKYYQTAACNDNFNLQAVFSQYFAIFTTVHVQNIPVIISKSFDSTLIALQFTEKITCIRFH
jgi:hypothetical protein